MRKPFIAANWKMFKTIGEAVSFIEDLQKETGPCSDREVVVAPPFTALSAVRKVMTQSGYELAAQNFHPEEKGAFTGEVSGLMIKDAGCRYVIIGHSERRHVFGETDETVGKKVASAFKQGLTPVLCIGEVLDEREAGKTLEVLERQLRVALQGLGGSQIEKLVIAYEPVWAIGTGKTATSAQAQEVHAFIRRRVAALFDEAVAKGLRILYGGSVKPANTRELMSQPDVDGALVGGASLEARSFSDIVKNSI
jgi:triosephosphate isomerase (TIM)